MHVTRTDCQEYRKAAARSWKWVVALLGSIILALIVTCIMAMSRAHAAYERADAVESEFDQAVDQFNIRLEAMHQDVREIRADVKAIKANGNPRQ